MTTATEGATDTKPAARITPSVNPAPTAEEFKKTTLTLTFEAKDKALYEQMTKDAEDEERTTPVNVLRFLRTNYPSKA